MGHPDEAYDKLSQIYNDFGDFCSKRGQVSEADTRAKVIDQILKEVLGWSEEQISREGSVGSGYYDYQVTYGVRKMFVVEAKKEGIAFDIPQTLRKRRRYKLSGCLKTNDLLRQAIEQVQDYCVENACRYAVASNGYVWIVFRALREDIPWRTGDCIVFASAGDVKKSFTEFWNLLSLDAVAKGSLDKSFSRDIVRPRLQWRPTQFLSNPDAPLTRNSYHYQLNPFVESIFRDIGEQGQLDILKKCYIYGKSLRVIDADLRLVIGDSIPAFASREGGSETLPVTRDDEGLMGREVSQAILKPFGTLFLLLGGIGCGKTTYIKRFLNLVGKRDMDQNALCFYVDFLAPPSSHEMAESYLFESVLQQYRANYSHLGLERRENLLRVYADEIELVKQTYLHDMSEENPAWGQRLSWKLEEWTRNVIEYTGRILRTARNGGKTVVLCVDNVDQLSPEYQSRIFLVAQRAARGLCAVVIVALREESYYAASIRKTFTAYNNRKFHIASPPFRYLVAQRMKYCRELLKLPEDRILVWLKSGVKFNKAEIGHFLNIIDYSIFTRNRNIARFIEAITFGNMREALDMFATFMYSGATNVDKMLKIYDREGNYFVSFHEFAKSALLGDRRYFKDTDSRILNVFDCGPEMNASHFTALRLMSLLLSHHNATCAEGRGFVGLDDVMNTFLDLFDNEVDLRRTITRLLQRGLVQVDTRSTQHMEGASYIRITSSGWYYVRYLVKAFAYLDLVFQDTPLSNESLAKTLKKSIVDVDRLPDIQEYISERMALRFKRVEMFVEYLSNEENEERRKYNLDQVHTIIGQHVMPSIMQQFERERKWISERITRKNDSQVDDDLEFDDTLPDFAGDEEVVMPEDDIMEAQTDLTLPETEGP